MSEWRPIETARKDETDIDVWVTSEPPGGPYCGRIADATWAFGEWYGHPPHAEYPVPLERKLGKYTHRVTHWMPRPEPPR